MSRKVQRHRRRPLPLSRQGRFLVQVLGFMMPVLLGTSSAFVSVPAEASTPTISLGTTSFPASTATNPDITLSGFDSSKTYQVTVKFVDSSNVDVTNGTLTVGTTAGLSLISGYSSYTAETKLGFKGTFANIQSALSSITWTPSATGADVRMRVGIAEDPGANSFYDANSGHYYEWESTNRSWADALADAQSRSKFGMTGYLAIITSRAENDFIKSETSVQNIWIGASDIASEGSWIWDGATGANKPTVAGSNAGTSASFHSWATNEPNNSGGNEDCAVTNWGALNGLWNDLNCAGTYDYLIEYGSRIGQTSTAISSTLTQVVTIVVAGAPGAPTITSITSGNGALSVNFTAGSGSGITSYQYSLDGGTWNNRASGTIASPIEINGLTNGTAYSVRIRAVNASGNGTASTAVSGTPSDAPVTPAPAPSMPSLKTPNFNAFASGPALVTPGQDLTLTGSRLSCTTNVQINSQPTNFRYGTAAGGLEQLRIAIPAGLPPGPHRMSMDSCGGQVTFENLLVVPKPPVVFEAVSTNALERMLVLARLQGFTAIHFGAYNHAECIVNASAPSLQTAAKEMFRNACRIATMFLSGSTGSTSELRNTHKPANVWVRVTLSNK